MGRSQVDLHHILSVDLDEVLTHIGVPQLVSLAAGD